MNVDLDPQLEDKIIAEALALRCTPSELIRRAFEKYEAEKKSSHDQDSPNGESVYESLSRAGLIGCIKEGPPDLSTNPMYMEGFGG